MRIVTIGLFAGFVVAVSDPALIPEQQVYAETELTQESPEIDPIVTGHDVSAEHLEKWKARRELYLECPECVASQPFPED